MTPCGSCDECVFRQTGVRPSPQMLMGFPTSTDCRVKGIEFMDPNVIMSDGIRGLHESIGTEIPITSGNYLGLSRITRESNPAGATYREGFRSEYDSGRSAGVLAERERCAKIAEVMIPEGGYTGNDWFRASRHIAAKIRSGQ